MKAARPIGPPSFTSGGVNHNNFLEDRQRPERGNRRIWRDRRGVTKCLTPFLNLLSDEFIQNCHARITRRSSRLFGCGRRASS
jgi:hypothetical protein